MPNGLLFLFFIEITDSFSVPLSASRHFDLQFTLLEYDVIPLMVVQQIQ